MGAVKDVYLGLQGYDHWKTTEPEWDCFDEEPITPEQEKLLAEEQERDLREIDAERAREEHDRIVSECCDWLVKNGWRIAAHQMCEALIEGEGNNGVYEKSTRST